MSNWTVIDDYSYTPVEVVRETKSTVFYKHWNYSRTAFVERKTLSALPWRGTEKAALLLSKQMQSARAERDRRMNEANIWFSKRKRELLGIQEPQQ